MVEVEPEFEKVETLAVTGPRRLQSRDTLKVQQTAVKILRKTRIRRVFLGGATGLDTVLLIVLRQFRDRTNKSFLPRLVVVVPGYLSDQPPDARDAAEKYADSIIELGYRITAEDGWEAFHIRNRYMIDEAGELLYFNNGSVQSGSRSAFNYARKIGVPVWEETLHRLSSRS